MLLASLGLLFVVSSFASGAVSSGFGGAGTKVAGYVISIIVNFGLFFISFRLMTDGDRPWTRSVDGRPVRGGHLDDPAIGRRLLPQARHQQQQQHLRDLRGRDRR